MKNIRHPYVWLWVLAVHLPGPVMGQANYSTPPYTFTTLAGNPGYGSVDGTGSAAQFFSPSGVAVDRAGNLYVSDSRNNTIRKVMPTGVVVTLAGLAGSTGTNDGTGNAAQFNYPFGMAVDSAGNAYVADSYNATIRKLTPAGVVTTLAGLAGNVGTNDGTGSAVRFTRPYGVAVDTAGSVYVADTFNETIRKVTPVGTNWVVTTLAGLGGSIGTNDGTGSAARFYYPYDVAVDKAANVYVADFYNSTIRKVTPEGAVTTLAGLARSYAANDGTGSVARFHFPSAVAVDNATNVYVADVANATIRKVTAAGVVTTLAGLAGSSGSADGTGSVARFLSASGVAVDSATNVYVTDSGNETIRRITAAGVVTTLAGMAASHGTNDGVGADARFYYPSGVTVDNATNVYVADNNNGTIRKVTPGGVVTTLTGQFFNPAGVAADNATNVYVADQENEAIYKITPAGVVTILAGLVGSAGSTDGTNSDALFNYPSGVAVDSATNVYVADQKNHTIRRATRAGTNWVVTTLAGLAGNAGTNDGPGIVARFYQPSGVAVDGAGNVYVADYYNDTIRKVTRAGTNWVVTTLAGLAGNYGSADGTNSDASFAYPYGVAVDAATNVYVADYYNDTIRKLTREATNWVVTTVAGLAGKYGSADGTGSGARFDYPLGVAVDRAGNLYVADQDNNTIRKGVPSSSVSAPMLDSPALTAGHFGFGITGLPGVAVDVESSGDFSQWQQVGTYVLNGGTNAFVNPTPPEGAQSYRGLVR